MGIPLRRRKGYSTKNSQSPRISVKTLASVKCLSPLGPLSLVGTLFEYDLKVERGTRYWGPQHWAHAGDAGGTGQRMQTILEGAGKLFLICCRIFVKRVCSEFKVCGKKVTEMGSYKEGGGQVSPSEPPMVPRPEDIME